MTASYSLALPAPWSDNATCAVHNRFEQARSPFGGDRSTEAALYFRLFTFFMSTVMENRRSEILSKRSREALFRLDRFSELAPNWDGYHAAVPEAATLYAAEKFIVRLDRRGIPPYFISPGPNGDVLIQYKCPNGHEAEVWIEGSGASTMLLITPDKPPYEASIDMDFLLAHLGAAPAQGDRPVGQ